MKKIDGKDYLEPYDVMERLGDRFGLDEIVEFIDSGELKGSKDENTWLISEREMESFVKKYVESDIYYLGIRKIDLSDLRLKGRVLDIGGGGEGVIGQLAGDRVIAIDKLKSELDEATECDCVKVVMDATEMGFTDRVFDTATAFFSLMYMKREDVIKVLRESYRVLKEDGEMHIWDLKIPENDAGDKKVYAILLKVDIGDKIIETGYGTSWNKVQDIEQISSIALESGFEAIERKGDGDTFYLRLRKRP